MTDQERKAMEIALDALENNLPLIEDYGSKEQLNIHHKAIAALYKTLAQPEPFKPDWDMIEPYHERIKELEIENEKLRQALAQGKQEPVAHLWECLGRWSAYLATNGTQADCAPPAYLIEAIKAATAPPSKPWVGFSLDEARRFSEGVTRPYGFILGVLWAEAKLKEKNNG